MLEEGQFGWPKKKKKNESQSRLYTGACSREMSWGKMCVKGALLIVLIFFFLTVFSTSYLTTTIDFTH